MKNLKLVTGLLMSKNSGFTLLEVLVVLVIVGVMLAVSSLVIGDRIREHQTKYFVENLRDELLFAEQYAILHSRVLGFSIDQKAYHFYQFDQSKWSLLKEDPILSPKSVPGYVIFSLDVKKSAPEKEDDKTPIITISSDGGITPFVLRAGRSEKSLPYQLHAKLSGEIKFKDQVS